MNTVKLILTRIFLVAGLLVAGTQSYCQFTVNGFLKDSATHEPLRGKVVNITAKKTVVTGDNGFFSIQAKPEDFMLASVEGYAYQTISYSAMFRDTITIFLANEGVVLPNVTVVSNYNRYQLDSMVRRTDFEQILGTTYNAVEGNHGPGFGVTVNLDRFFKKKYRDKKDQQKTFNETEQMMYVNYRFSPEIVAMYTGLKGEELQAFMRKYNPGYKWLRQHPTNEDVLYYINDKLKKSGKY